MNNLPYRFGRRIIIGVLASAVILLVFILVRRHSIVSLMGWEVSKMASITIQQLFLFLTYQSMTLAIIWAIFYDLAYVRFAAIIMLLVFIGLVPPYLYLTYIGQDGQTAVMIAIRQLAFNPSLLMILLPALYYQRRVSSLQNNS